MHQQKAEAVRTACVEIDSALAMVEGDGEAYLEQRWDLETMQHGSRPCLALVNMQVAALRSISQSLVERAAKDGGGVQKSVEEMVLVALHKFLDVFSKYCLERLPQHCKHDLGIELVDGAVVPPPGKLYQLAPAELQVLHQFSDNNLAKGYI